MKKIIAISAMVILSCSSSPSSFDKTTDIVIEEIVPSINSFPTPYSGNIKGLHFDETSILITSGETNSGLFRYDIQTGIWNRLTGGRFSEVLRINEKKIVVGGDSEILISKDNGDSWTRSLSNGHFFFRDIQDLSIGLDHSVIAVLNNSGSNSNVNMVRSSNGEGNWVDISTPQPVQRVILHNEVLYATGFNGVYTSTNNGEDWNLEFEEGGHSIFTDQEGGIWVIKEYKALRLNSGDWTSFPRNVQMDATLTATIDEKNQMYFATENSVYRYYPEDGSLELITELDLPIYITNIEVNNSTIFISTLQRGLYTVASNATNGEASLFGIPIQANEILKDDNNNLFLRSKNVGGTDQFGLFLKRTNQGSWKKISSDNNQLVVTPNDGLVQFLHGKTVKHSKDLGTTWEQETLSNEQGLGIFVSVAWIGINQKLRIIGYSGEEQLNRKLLEYDNGVWSTLLSWDQQEMPENVIENSHGIFIAHSDGLQKINHNTMGNPQLINTGEYFTQLKKDGEDYIYGRNYNGDIFKIDPTGMNRELLFKNESNKYYRILFIDSIGRLWIKVNIINTQEQNFEKSYILVLDEKRETAVKLDVPNWSTPEVTNVVETSSYVISTPNQGLQKFNF